MPYLTSWITASEIDRHHSSLSSLFKYPSETEITLKSSYLMASAMLIISRSQVFCLLVALLSISSAVSTGAMGARHPRLDLGRRSTAQTWKKLPEYGGEDRSVGAMKREVPSSSDPLHNR
ncbi:hypothetical protein SAY87_015423 [Trapa incisa]|uniref:Uncharacterized protein n=1 Tax=Trapa incisa TaxID=236973 RepID=A0AAN7JLD1_9MYRT|nr:hypothetical protein SAY87_015423 [Trapa incisa]